MCTLYSCAQSIHQTLGLHYVMAKKKKIYEIPETKLVRGFEPDMNVCLHVVACPTMHASTF